LLGARCQVPGAWCRVPGARCQVPGAKCQVPGARCSGARFQVLGARCQVPGARCLVPGARCQVPGARCQVPGARCPRCVPSTAGRPPACMTYKAGPGARSLYSEFNLRRPRRLLGIPHWWKANWYSTIGVRRAIQKTKEAKNLPQDDQSFVALNQCAQGPTALHCTVGAGGEGRGAVINTV
jgi:hypothetical protein